MYEFVNTKMFCPITPHKKNSYMHYCRQLYSYTVKLVIYLQRLQRDRGEMMLYNVMGV